MKKIVLLSIASILISTSFVSAGGVATGVKIGTLGLGADVTIGLHERLNLRLNGNYLSYDYDDEIDDIEYTLDLDFKSGMALADWHPFANGFRITGGAIFNENGITMDATPTKNKEIGGRAYTPAQIGTLHGEIEFDNVSPYAGIGFGHAVGENQRLSFIFDLGVIFQSYEFDLSSDGLAAQSPQFQADLAEEEKDVQDTLDDFKIYPVIAFGIALKF